MPEIQVKPAQISFDVIVEVFNILERKLIGQQRANENEGKDTKRLIKNIHNTSQISVYSPRFKNSKNIFKDKLKQMIPKPITVIH